MSSPSRRARHAHLIVLAGLLAIGLAGCATTEQESGHHRHRRDGRAARTERFTAFAVNLGTRADLPTGQSGTVEIQIDRLSRPAERAILLAALRDGGSDALLKALQNAKVVGSIRTPDHVGLDLHYASERPTDDGGRRIILATDRRIGFWEAANQTLSTNYPFTVIELRLDREGHGEGRMSIATKITESPDKDQIELENFTTDPVRLQDVTEIR